MNNYLIELLILNVNIAALFMLYMFVKNRLRISHRRIILLLIPLFSFIPEFVTQIEWVASSQIQVPVYQLNPFTISPISQQKNDLPTTTNIALVIYLIGFFFLLFRYTYSYLKIRAKINASKFILKEGVRIFSTQETTSFSFFRNIVLSDKLGDEAREMIFNHEKLHVEQFHSLDKLYFALIHSFCWFNPFFNWITKELDAVQEYQVDSLLYKKYGSSYTHLILQQSLGTVSVKIKLSNQFGTNSNLKTRIIMMTTMAKKSWKTTVVFPLMLVLMTTISWKTQAQVTQHERKAKPTKEEPYTYVKNMPEFVGGEQAMMKFIQENINFSKQDTVYGTTYIQFVINKIGEVTDVKVARGISPSFDAECVRLIQSMPNWIPGKKHGKNVAVRLVIPIKVEPSE